jgi:hypothetical protein
MKNYYKHTTQLEVYELLDKAIATSDEVIFYVQLKHLLDRRKEEGLTFNDHKRFVLPPRKAWRQIIRKIKKLPKEVE